ncbi:Rhomboid family protein [Posidoniimonas polymericola]|uniref:Rhomboid family protein n=1 Tax=Posidoniimonas polymericola TaxID=2528002 RepID=A0A5C5ZE93_9BACT|nr:rhomboid family intramembrane serine protease [Posidoniimonas polymericola]TWT85485.1 Rhomboid family protein [Posidoniimonas polymericola]
MGIYDRDYERQPQWRDSYGGGGGLQLRFPITAVNQIVVVTLAAYFIEILFNGPRNPQTGVIPNPAIDALALQPLGWLQAPWRVYEIATYALAHSQYDLFHVLGNMFGVWMFGRELEGRFGYKEFLAYYLGAVLAGGLAIVAWDFATQSPSSTIGASAGTVAVVVLFALLYPHRTVLLMFVFPIPMWVLGAFIVGNDLMRAFGENREMVSFQGHLGGAAFAAAYHFQHWRLAGWLPGELSLPSLKRRPKLRVHSEPDDDSDAAMDKLEVEVDRILKKISDHGADSLTAKEKRLMERASREFKGRRRL